MKTLVLSMISIAATVAAMTACTSESDPINDITNPKDAKVEIKLNAGVLGVETKAAITTSTTFIATIAGWEGSTAPSTTTQPTWNTTTEVISGGATSAEVKLTTPQYYNPNGEKTFIIGYYPTGTLKDGKVTFTNTKGDVDVMMTSIEDAGTRTSSSATAITFSHKLSQLKMNIKKDNSLNEDVTLTSITVKNAEIPTGFDIATGEITYETAKDIAISNISNNTINSNSGSAGDAIMIKPISTKQITLDIVTSQGTFTNIPVTLSTEDTHGGTSYDIELTFKKKAIDVTATVTDWTQANGTGEVI